MISRIIRAEVANRGLVDSRYHAKTEFNDYFIIQIRFIPMSYKFNYFDKMLELLCFILEMFPLLLLIITEYQELFVDRQPIKTEIVHKVNNNNQYNFMKIHFKFISV